MKKAVIAVATVMFLISCGGSVESVSSVDSTVVDSVKAVDSSLTATDSTVAEIPADSTK